MNAILAATVVAHVPTLARQEITPEFQRTLVEGERALGAGLRRLKPDLWVIASTHWVSTFNWFATCQATHRGVCVADEAPDLIPGMPYSYQGDPAFAGALVDEWMRLGIPAGRNDSPHYSWDYGTFVPLSHLDPHAEVPVVAIPVVLMADHAECMRAGAAVHAVARALGRRAIFVASTALSHALVRGRHHVPALGRAQADATFIAQLQRGAIDELVSGFADYSRLTAAEMGGRVLATLLGVLQSMRADGPPLAGRRFGAYAQSSGSGNANVVVADAGTLSNLG